MILKLFCHFGYSAFSNIYIINQDGEENVIIVDPGIMDLQLLNLIENNGFYVKHILVTNNDHSHVNGIRTLKKIYDADIYSYTELPCRNEFIKINHGDKLNLDGITIDVINVPGQSMDSVCFKIQNMLFTGDTIFAGSIASDLTREQLGTLKKFIKERIFSLDDDTLIFPGHGSPSTMSAEKAFNPHLKDLA